MDENLKRLISSWRQKADHDRGLARLAIDASSVFTDGICFHSQQAAEKDLKACCILLSIDFERKHDLAYLLDIINEKKTVSDEMYDWAEKLQQYAVEVRYPDLIDEPGFEDACEAYQISVRFREFLDRILSEVS
jgi:HEPN domain-containing protein